MLCVECNAHPNEEVALFPDERLFLICACSALQNT